MKKTLAVILSVMMMLPLCFAFSASAATSSTVYIADINGAGSQNGPKLFYGSGEFETLFGLTNYDWWDKVIATFDETAGTFVVTDVYPAVSGDFNYKDAVLGANDVMLWAWEWGGYNGILDQLAAGDKIYIYGFDFTNGSSTDMSDNSVYFTTYSPTMGNGYYGYVGSVDPEDPVEPEVPVVKESNVESLGAKVNTEKYGLRMGATLTKDNSRGEVISLGMLVISEKALGSNELNLEYAATDKNVVDVKARTIDNYVEGKEFEDYDSITYYVTILGLENYTSENIVARPYVVYRSQTGEVVYYGEERVRSYDGVAAAAIGE